MRYPDEILPHLQLGIPDLVARAKAALDAGFSDDFVALMIAGRATVDGEDHRIVASGYQNVEPARLEDCTLTGDFDSLIGFTPRLELKVPLSVYPVPSFKHTLRTSVHASIIVNGGDRDAVRFCFASNFILFTLISPLAYTCACTSSWKHLHRDIWHPSASAATIP